MDFKLKASQRNTTISYLITILNISCSLWTPGPESNFLEDMRYFRGFVQIQDMISKAVVQLTTKDYKSVEKRAEGHEDWEDWEVYTQQAPYPCYRRDL